MVLLKAKLLQQRYAATAYGGAGAEAVNCTIFSGEQETVVTYGPPSTHDTLPCRSLSSPYELEVARKGLGNPTADKICKKVTERLPSKVTAEKGKSQLSCPNPDQKVFFREAPSDVQTHGCD